HSLPDIGLRQVLPIHARQVCQCGRQRRQRLEVVAADQLTDAIEAARADVGSRRLPVETGQAQPPQSQGVIRAPRATQILEAALEPGRNLVGPAQGDQVEPGAGALGIAEQPQDLEALPVLAGVLVEAVHDPDGLFVAVLPAPPPGWLDPSTTLAFFEAGELEEGMRL